MQTALRIAQGIDRLNDWIGKAVSWLTLIMVLTGSYNALVRYAGRAFGWQLSSNAYLELQWYMFSLLFLLGAAYTLRKNAHVRVDILYAKLPVRKQAWIDLTGHGLFLLPFCGLMIWASWAPVHNSWMILEGSPDPGGLPRYPIKTVIPIAFMLLCAQGISAIIHDIAFLRGVTAASGEAYHRENPDGV